MVFSPYKAVSHKKLHVSLIEYAGANIVRLRDFAL